MCGELTIRVRTKEKCIHDLRINSKSLATTIEDLYTKHHAVAFFPAYGTSKRKAPKLRSELSLDYTNLHMLENVFGSKVLADKLKEKNYTPADILGVVSAEPQKELQAKKIFDGKNFKIGLKDTTAFTVFLKAKYHTRILSSLLIVLSLITATRLPNLADAVLSASYRLVANDPIAFLKRKLERVKAEDTYLPVELAKNIVLASAWASNTMFSSRKVVEIRLNKGNVLTACPECLQVLYSNKRREGLKRLKMAEEVIDLALEKYVKTYGLADDKIPKAELLLAVLIHAEALLSTLKYDWLPSLLVEKVENIVKNKKLRDIIVKSVFNKLILDEVKKVEKTGGEDFGVKITTKSGKKYIVRYSYETGHVTVELTE